MRRGGERATQAVSDSAANRARVADASSPAPRQDFSSEYEGLVEIGEIMGAHGVHGEVKVRPETDEPDARLGTAGRRLIGGRVGVSAHRAAPKPLTLLTGREVLFKGMPGWIMRFAEVETREAAEALRGQMLYFPTSDREDLGKDDSTFYIQDLVGLQVATVAGQHVGRVVEVCDGTGSHDCLRVLREPETAAEGVECTTLVPFVREIVPVVDVEKGVLQIDPPEGLLDLVTRGPWRQERRTRVDPTPTAPGKRKRKPGPARPSTSES